MLILLDQPNNTWSVVIFFWPATGEPQTRGTATDEPQTRGTSTDEPQTSGTATDESQTSGTATDKLLILK